MSASSLNRLNTCNGCLVTLTIIHKAQQVKNDGQQWAQVYKSLQSMVVLAVEIVLGGFIGEGR